MSSIDVSEKAGVRFLHFSSDWVQGAMRIARPYSLELAYTREMMLPLLMRDPDWPRHALLVGLGAASQLRFLWRYRPQATLTVVEIDPQVIAAARQFFKLPDDPERIRLHIADAADFIIDARARYDLILVDGFDADARANRLDSLPFYLDCRARLADDGIFCVNLLSRRRDFGRSVSLLTEAFEDQVLAFPSADLGNAIAVALPNPPLPPMTIADLMQADSGFRKTTHLSLMPLISRLGSTRLYAGGVLKL